MTNKPSPSVEAGRKRKGKKSAAPTADHVETERAALRLERERLQTATHVLTVEGIQVKNYGNSAALSKRAERLARHSSALVAFHTALDRFHRMYGPLDPPGARPTRTRKRP